jgi:hypothetical protein
MSGLVFRRTASPINAETNKTASTVNPIAMVLGKLDSFILQRADDPP